MLGINLRYTCLNTVAQGDVCWFRTSVCHEHVYEGVKCFVDYMYVQAVFIKHSFPLW